MTVPKRLKTVVSLAEAHGWSYDVTSKGHPRLNPPRGATDGTGALMAPCIFSNTPGDKTSDRNAIAYLRRMGVPIPR